MFPNVLEMVMNSPLSTPEHIKFAQTMHSVEMKKINDDFKAFLLL